MRIIFFARKNVQWYRDFCKYPVDPVLYKEQSFFLSRVYLFYSWERELLFQPLPLRFLFQEWSVIYLGLIKLRIILYTIMKLKVKIIQDNFSYCSWPLTSSTAWTSRDWQQIKHNLWHIMFMWVHLYRLQISLPKTTAFFVLGHRFLINRKKAHNDIRFSNKVKWSLLFINGYTQVPKIFYWMFRCFHLY